MVHRRSVWQKALLPVAIALLAQVSFSSFANAVVIDEDADYYEMLEASRSTSTAQLKPLFRKQSLLYHPDKNRNDPNADTKFHLIHKAYQVLKDPKTRKMYDKYGAAWEDMQEYIKKLVSVRQQLFQQRGQMFVKNVETKIDEPFLNERYIQILHPSFAAKHLAGRDVVWVIFFGNPGCAPCRALAPKLKNFANQMKPEDRKWLKVGSVNMAVDQNMELLRQFGEAAEAIPQLILLAPNNHSPGYGDFEVIPGALGKTLNAADLAAMLMRASKALFQNKLQKLDQMPTAQDKEAGPTVALVSKPTRECNMCTNMLPVFRRIARRFRDSAITFRELDCHTTPSLCEDVSTPNLMVWEGDSKKASDPSSEPKIAQMPVFTDSTSMHNLYGYDVAQVAMDAQLRSTISMLLRTLPVSQEPQVPSVLVVKGVPNDMAYLKQEFFLQPERHQGRPIWATSSKNAALRWLPGSFRDNSRGAWLISDNLNAVDRGWGYVEEDSYVPRMPMQGVWTIATRGAFRVQTAFGFMAKGAGHDEL